MKNVRITVNAVKTEHAPGTVGGNWFISVVYATGAPIPMDYSGPEPSNVFELEQGKYTVKAHRFSDDKEPLGDVIYENFTVVEIPNAVIATAGSFSIEQLD